MKTLSIFGYTITVSRNISKFPTGNIARRKMAQKVEDTREPSREVNYPKIKRIKCVHLMVQNAGLKEAKEWVEVAFLNHGQGEIV